MSWWLLRNKKTATAKFGALEGTETAEILKTAAGDADYLRHYDVMLSQFT
jgi:hypothetical protein